MKVARIPNFTSLVYNLSLSLEICLKSEVYHSSNCLLKRKLVTC